MHPIDAEARRDFEEGYDAQIITSQRRYRRVKRTTMADMQMWYASGQHYPPPELTTQTEDVEMIEIIMPKDKLPALLESQYAFLHNRMRKEQRLRETYPALQSAWEQYQIVLMMVK